MRKGGGKQKGAAFEREICKKLSLWVSNGSRLDLFWRSAMSGGRATLSLKEDAKDRVDTGGDISAVQRQGFDLIDNFYIECKFYKDLGFAPLVTSGKGKLVDFWKIANNQALAFNKYAMVIAKQNHYPIILCISLGGLGELRSLNLKPNVIIDSMYIFELDRFLEKVRVSHNI
jgi:hypothetical protein